MQTEKEVKGIYIAWMLGAKIEIKHECHNYWQHHETFNDTEDEPHVYYIWMMVHDKYDSDTSEAACKEITFRISPENTDATD